MLTKQLPLATCILFLSFPLFAQQNPGYPGSRPPEAEQFHHGGLSSVSLSLLDTHRTDASSLFLIGRDCYMAGDFKKATRYLKKAVTKAPENSEYADWLGRAYYRRAETSDPLSGVVMTKKARQAFERAVQLNGRNADALSDLFDYYLETPGVLGGGHDKAANVIGMMSTVDPAQAFFEEWKLAQRLPQLRSEPF